MTRKPEWRKLYLFVAVACITLFFFPPTNQWALIIWLVVAYGGVALWLHANQSEIAKQPYREPKTVVPVVTEFFDEDRIHLQEQGIEWADSNFYESHNEEA